MTFQRAADQIITAIRCDQCLSNAFMPIFEQGEETDEDIAWDQAAGDGWVKVILINGSYEHACPKCSQEVTKHEHRVHR